ncbi:MAG: FtsQ-type POTRA domain-containing protein [Emcibacter sp.]|nr:FtsQ-type POTRA domain-containing protein [Emcibacter sp.]
MWPLNKKPKKSSKSKATSVKRGAKQAQSLVRRRRISLFFRVFGLLGAVTVVVLSIYIWKSGLLQEWTLEARDTVDREIAKAGFMVGEVRITGQGNTDINQIRTALALYDGQSIVSLNLPEMLGRVEALPWVKQATIIRKLPDALDVTITEHEAAAIWQEDGALFLVDQHGTIITDAGLEKFADVPHIVGAGANENLVSLLALKAAYPDLFSRVKSAVWVGQRRWDLNFYNGIKIKLPEKETGLAWQLLYEYESNQKILAKDILVIDLRQHGKTILRLTPQEAERRRLLKNSGAKEESI